MARKLYDLAVKVGEYTNQSGETKGRWANVGAVIQQEDGGKFVLIDPHFNFAAVQRAPGKDRVPVSMFAPDSQGQGYAQGAPQQAQGGYQVPAQGYATSAPQRPAQGGHDYAGDIPF